MNGLAILIPASLILGTVGLVTFLWTVPSNEYDDHKGKAARRLPDDDGPIKKTAATHKRRGGLN